MEPTLTSIDFSMESYVSGKIRQKRQHSIGGVRNDIKLYVKNHDENKSAT